MRPRIALALATAAVVAGAFSGQAATKTPVLDGKKLKKIEFKGDAGTQENDSEFVTAQVIDPGREKCAPPKCLRQDFVFKPAAGKTGDVLVQVSWTGAQYTDIDLRVIDSASKTIASCEAGWGNKEWVVLKNDKLESGKTYTAIAYFFRTYPSSTVTGSIEFPGPAAPAKGVMADNILLGGQGSCSA